MAENCLQAGLSLSISRHVEKRGMSSVQERVCKAMFVDKAGLAKYSITHQTLKKSERKCEGCGQGDFPERKKQERTLESVHCQSR